MLTQTISDIDLHDNFDPEADPSGFNYWENELNELVFGIGELNENILF